MNKKRLHHIWTKLRPISPWYFLVLAVISGIISINALRQNNLTMVRLRDEVFKADQQNTDVETPLRHLREFVYAHTNTNLSSGSNAVKPPFSLNIAMTGSSRPKKTVLVPPIHRSIPMPNVSVSSKSQEGFLVADVFLASRIMYPTAVSRNRLYPTACISLTLFHPCGHLIWQAGVC